MKSQSVLLLRNRLSEVIRSIADAIPHLAQIDLDIIARSADLDTAKKKLAFHVNNDIYMRTKADVVDLGEFVQNRSAIFVATESIGELTLQVKLLEQARLNTSTFLENQKETKEILSREVSTYGQIHVLRPGNTSE